jgi:hypothetical protein
MSNYAAEQEQDLNLVAIWLRKDPVRWSAGVLAGLFAGLISLIFAMALASVSGVEIWYPVRLAALPFLGNIASALDSSSGIIVGFIVYEAICAALGLFYAHVAATNSFPALLGAGFTFGAFSWIFIFNLFSQSFKDVYAMRIAPGPAFLVMMVFGFSLVSVSFFDRLLRGKSS